MFRRLFFSASIFLAGALFFSQEALKSTEEEYYDFLSLSGITERPTLGYRTLSDSEWSFALDKEENSLKDSEGNIWKNNNLGKKRRLWQSENQGKNWFTQGFDHSLTLKIYGPEWYNSYNTAAPYGQNDGALWQGKGYNTSLTGGVRLEGYGFEVTVKPQVSFSQNLEFDLMDNSAYYSNKYAYTWGYGNDVGADAPQRFGDSAFWTYDWGDTELRWAWKAFTVGFGTQSPWIGPAWLNPVLHSNNAPTYPKFDIGLRKTQVHLPWLGWYIGNIEARMWIGRLSESDYFDDDSSNDHNQITGMTFSYAPSFLPGLTLGITKVCLSKWNDGNFYKYLNPFYGTQGAAYGNESEDQKIAFSASWLSTRGGIEAYAEFAVDDHINASDRLDSYITHYWHTFVYTFGLKKEIPVCRAKKIRGEVIFEWNNTEMSQDMQAQWAYNFGFHHIITQGYTNEGQWLGSGIGYGGQSQYLAVKIYYPKGMSTVYAHRYNPDNSILFKEAIYDVSTGDTGSLHTRTWNCYKGILALGFSSIYFLTNQVALGGGLTYVRIVNPLYNQQKNHRYDVWNSFQFRLSCKVNL